MSQRALIPLSMTHSATNQIHLGHEFVYFFCPLSILWEARSVLTAGCKQRAKSRCSLEIRRAPWVTNGRELQSGVDKVKTKIPEWTFGNISHQLICKATAQITKMSSYKANIPSAATAATLQGGKQQQNKTPQKQTQPPTWSMQGAWPTKNNCIQMSRLSPLHEGFLQAGGH